jgi:hypothetical protein
MDRLEFFGLVVGASGMKVVDGKRLGLLPALSIPIP